MSTNEFISLNKFNYKDTLPRPVSLFKTRDPSGSTVQNPLSGALPKIKINKTINYNINK